MQKKPISSVKQLKQLLLPDIRLINRQWLQQLLPDYWLEKCLHSNHALNLLNVKFHRDYSVPIPEKMQLEPCQRWLLLDIDEQNELAKTIGASVCAGLIRAVIEKDQTAMLVKQLGDEFYFTALNSNEISATGVSSAEFKKHLARDQLCQFLIAVGISALQNTLDCDSEYFRLRMKFSFPKYCWKIKPVLNQMDMQTLRLCLRDSSLMSVEGETNA